MSLQWPKELTLMSDFIKERSRKLSDFFELGADVELLAPEASKIELSPEVAEGLNHFNIEWHVIPSEKAVPLNEVYMARLYPHAPRDFTKHREHSASYRDQIVKGRARHQGQIIGVETTQKPRYLPEERQFYGSLYGHDASADPFAPYLGRAGMVNGTRYAHNYLSLREFIRVVNEDWRSRSILPAGYRSPGMERDGDSRTGLLPRRARQRYLLRRRLERPGRLLLHQ
jgi:hypothetical protein